MYDKFVAFEALEDVVINELLDDEGVEDFVVRFLVTDCALGPAGGALARLDFHIQPAVVLLDGVKHNH